MADETFKVDTGEEPDTSIKVEQEVDTPEEEEDDSNDGGFGGLPAAPGYQLGQGMGSSVF